MPLERFLRHVVIYFWVWSAVGFVTLVAELNRTKITISALTLWSFPGRFIRI
jgi:hypothetical protein